MHIELSHMIPPLHSTHGMGSDCLLGPTMAVPDGDGFFVVDYLHNRFVRITPQSGIIWTWASPVTRVTGLEDTLQYGHLLPCGTYIFIGNDHGSWLNWVSRDGTIVRRENLHERLGPGLYRHVHQGSDSVLTFVDQKNNRVVVADEQLHILWEYKPGPHVLRSPRRAYRLENGNVLVTDDRNDWVFEVDCRGTIHWSFGECGQSGSGPRRLCSPQDARRTAHGTTLITDTRNNRVLEVDDAGSIVWSYGMTTPGAGTGQLWHPRSSVPLEDGTILITDSRNDRLLQVDRSGGLKWSFGLPLMPEHLFNLPRCVVDLGGGRLLVADTYNDRVVEVDRDGHVLWQYGGSETLHWPRSAIPLTGEHVLLSDSRNGRLLQVDRNGQPTREWSSFHYGDRTVPVGDPHDLTVVPGGNLLFADSVLNAVVEMSPDGEVVWSLGLDQPVVSDPHQARRTLRGTTFVADTGNDRIIEVDDRGQVLWELRHVTFSDGRTERLLKPRFFMPLDQENGLVLDTARSRILLVSRMGEVLDCYHRPVGQPSQSLYAPRWIAPADDPRCFWVADTYNNRLLLFRLTD